MMKGDSFSVRSSPTQEFLGSSEVTLQRWHCCRAPHTSEELAVPVETLLSLKVWKQTMGSSSLTQIHLRAFSSHAGLVIMRHDGAD